MSLGLVSLGGVEATATQEGKPVPLQPSTSCTYRRPVTCVPPTPPPSAIPVAMLGGCACPGGRDWAVRLIPRLLSPHDRCDGFLGFLWTTTSPPEMGPRTQEHTEPKSRPESTSPPLLPLAEWLQGLNKIHPTHPGAWHAYLSSHVPQTNLRPGRRLAV